MGEIRANTGVNREHLRRTLLAVVAAAGAQACVYDLDQLRRPVVTDAGAPNRDATPAVPEVFPTRPPPAVELPPDAVGRESLVAYWPMDEGQGGFVWDVTGNGNDGALLLDPLWRPIGFPAAKFRNPAELQFDGKGGYVEFLLRTIPAIHDPKTISLWARYDYEVVETTIEVMVAILNRAAGAGVRLEFRHGKLKVSSYNYNEIVAVAAPKLGWHHFAYAFSGNQHILYVDGEQAAVSTVPAEMGAVVGEKDGRCRIGRSSSGVPDAFRGFMDDVRIYNRALTAAEVKSLWLGQP